MKTPASFYSQKKGFLKGFFSWIGIRMANALVFSVFTILFIFGIVYALTYPSTPPDGEVTGGKFMNYFSQILVDTSTSSDGTVKNAQKLDGLTGVSYQRRVTGTCGTNQALQSINSDGTVGCLDMVTAFTYAWDASSWSACSATCGAGTQTRTVQCLRNGSLVVADSFCAGAKPASSQACSTSCATTFSSIDWYMGGNTNDTTAQRRIKGARTDGAGNLYITDFVDSCCSYASGISESLVCNKAAVESANGCWFYAPSGGAYGYTNYGAYGRAKVSGNTLTVWTCGLSSCGPSGSAAGYAGGTFVGTATP